MPIRWAFRAHVMGIDSPCVGHLLPILWALSAQSLGRFLGNIVSKLFWRWCKLLVRCCLMVLLVLHYAASMQLTCCFYDTSCCFYDTSMILLVKEREMYHFDNTLSISCITYYFKSKMRLWYIFREKISFVCKLLPIYEPCLSVIYSSYPYDFFYSVTCQLHAPSTVLKGFCSVLGLFRVAQLHELCPSDDLK